MNPATEETLLVLRATCDDREALEALLVSVQPSLRRYLVSIVGVEDAPDVLQDTLVQICRKVRWLEQPECFRPWAFRIASRLAFRHLRQHRRRSAASTQEDLLDTIATSAEIEPIDESLLDELLAHPALSPASRAVLLLHFREEMRLAEIAAILELPLGTVKSRLAFGLKTLRTHLGRRS